MARRSRLIAAAFVFGAAMCACLAGCGFATASPSAATSEQSGDDPESAAAIARRTAELCVHPDQGRLYAATEAPKDAPKFSMDAGMSGQVMLFADLQFGLSQQWNAAFEWLHSCPTGHATTFGDEPFIFSGKVQLDLGAPVSIDVRSLGSVDMAEYWLTFTDATHKPQFLSALSNYVQEAKQRAEAQRRKVESEFSTEVAQAKLHANLWVTTWEGVPDAELFITLNRNASCGPTQSVAWQTTLLDAVLHSIYLDQQAKGAFGSEHPPEIGLE